MTTHSTTARITTSTTAPAISGIGCPSGIAAKLSLPNIGRPTFRFCQIIRQSRPRTRWKLLGSNRIEQPGVFKTKGHLVFRDKLLRQLLVGLGIQHFAAAARRALDPIRECKRRDDVHVEQHARKTVTAEMP